MQVTTDNIWQVITGDFYVKFEYKFRGELGDRQRIESVCGFGAEQFPPLKLRAMWNYYISDPDEVERGISISRFLQPRLLMRLAAKVYVTKDGAPGKKLLYPIATYRCENYFNRCGANDFILITPKGADAADRHEEACHRCQGNMIRMDLWQAALAEGKLAIMTLPPVPISPATGSDGVPQDTGGWLGDEVDFEGVEEFF